MHTLPQPPQLFRSVLVLISQPLAALPSQLAKPAEQAMLQAPAEQGVAVATREAVTTRGHASSCCAGSRSIGIRAGVVASATWVQAVKQLPQL